MSATLPNRPSLLAMVTVPSVIEPCRPRCVENHLPASGRHPGQWRRPAFNHVA